MIQRVVLSFGILVVMALFGEVVIRLAFHAEVDTESLRERNTAVSILPITQYSRDPELLFELKPNIDVDFLGVPVSTDAGGTRVPAANLRHDPDPDALRIAVLGDSTSFGWGVRHADTYPERLGRALQNQLGRKVHVRNFSVPGYNAHQERRLFETRVAPFEPDLVILHHDPNDAEPIGKFTTPLGLHPEFGDNLLHSAVVKFVHRRSRLIQYQYQYLLEKIASQNQYVNGYFVSGRLYDDHLNARRELLRRAKAQDTPVIAVLFYCCAVYDERYEESETYRILHKKLDLTLTDAGYHVLDLYPKYQRLMQRRGWSDLVPVSRSAADRHPNAQGHAFIAEQIGEFIARSGLLERLARD